MFWRESEGWMSVEHWCNDADSGLPNYFVKNLSQYHIVHLKSHVNWPGMEPGYPGSEASD